MASNVLVLIGPFVRKHRLGKTYGAETGFILGRGPHTLRAADAGFVTAERVRRIM